MAKIKEDKVETVVVDSSKDVLNGILKTNKTEHFNFHERKNWKCSTGSLLLDRATGGVTPSLWRLCGKSNGGKTPEMLEILRNIFISVPKSKALWVIAEGRGLSEENVSRCGLKFVYSAEEWDYGTVFVLETKIFELFINTVQSLVFNNPNENVYAFVVDSIDGLILRADADKPIDGNNKVAGTPMLAKKMLQSLSLGMFKFGHFMGLISQKTVDIKIDPRGPSADRGGDFSGGNALFHGSDIILEFNNNAFQKYFILDDPNGKLNDSKSKPIGQESFITLAKASKEEFKKTTISYPIKYGRKPSGIWVEREIVDMLFMFKLLEKGGAWCNFAPSFIKEIKDNMQIDLPESINGINKVYEYFENNNEDLVKYLFAKFTKMLAGL